MKWRRSMKVLKKYLSVYGLMWKLVTDYRFEFVVVLVCTLIRVVKVKELYFVQFYIRYC